MDTNAANRRWLNATRPYTYPAICCLLFIAALLLRFFISSRDPFLHHWDERFHALVAMHMLDDPFTPVLKADPLHTVDPLSWCCSAVWLHKQPWFLWQMAVSMKLLGVNVMAVRMPSIIIDALMVPIIMRITLLATADRLAAITAGVIICCSNFHLQLISGILGMDHNDIAFTFYILLSLWAFAEHTRSGKTAWIILIGLFAGVAVLNKWLGGMLVFVGWTATIALLPTRREQYKALSGMMIAIVIACIVFVPWQLYIFHRWPELARHEFKLNEEHIWQVVEGHGGSAWFYVQHLPRMLGPYTWWPLPLGLLFAFRSVWRKHALATALLVNLLFSFLFFSLVAQTKIINLLAFTTPLLALYIGQAVSSTVRWAHARWLLVALLPVVACSAYDPKRFDEYFAHENHDREVRVNNSEIYKHLREKIGKDVSIVMNVSAFEDIDLMFYQPGITAYHWSLSEEDMQQLAARHAKVAAFASHGPFVLPDYVYKYPHIIIIPDLLK